MSKKKQPPRKWLNRPLDDVSYVKPGQKNKATSRSLCHYYKQTPSAIDEDVGVKIRRQEGVFGPVRLQFRGRCDITLCVHDMHTKSES